MRDEAYHELRSLIVEGTLAPGERLRDQEIARWLSVSRTPVREALTRLADEGLVEMAPQRWTRVRRLSVEDARAGFPLAAALHGLATETGTHHVEERDAQRLAEAAERYAWALLREDHAELLAADDAYHEVIVEVAANELLAASLERLVPRLRRLERSAEMVAARRGDPHPAISEAIERRDAPAAAGLVVAEWRAAGELVVAALGSAQAVSRSAGQEAG
jgi:DNA-binding GntR family transcriptional regulator